MAAAPVLMVAPFALGFAPPRRRPEHRSRDSSIGLATSVYGDGERGNLPLSAHAGLDYTLAAATIAAGVMAGIAGDYVATVFLVGFGSAHMALTASTRFSRPLGA